MEIFQEKGKTGRKYYVFCETDNVTWGEMMEQINKVARIKKVNPLSLCAKWVWILGDELYRDPVEGSTQTIAVTTRGER